jgi:hypothetical protein
LSEECAFTLEGDLICVDYWWPYSLGRNTPRDFCGTVVQSLGLHFGPLVVCRTYDATRARPPRHPIFDQRVVTQLTSVSFTGIVITFLLLLSRRALF